jgi:hypothetical protein
MARPGGVRVVRTPSLVGVLDPRLDGNDLKIFVILVRITSGNIDAVVITDGLDFHHQIAIVIDEALALGNFSQCGLGDFVFAVDNHFTSSTFSTFLYCFAIDKACSIECN